jgi:hypothetical protein
MKQPSLPELFGVVKRAIRLLDNLGIDYHLTGGLVSSFYGDPRFTQDVDIVVRLDTNQAGALHNALEQEFQVDPNVLMTAVSQHDMFQALDRDTFIKIDFHVGEEIPDELSRSIRAEIIQGLEINIPSIEDAIASKLHWIKLGSHKSREDVIGMLQSGHPINQSLLESLCESLDLKNLLFEMIQAAKKD